MRSLSSGTSIRFLSPVEKTMRNLQIVVAKMGNQYRHVPLGLAHLEEILKAVLRVPDLLIQVGSRLCQVCLSLMKIWRPKSVPFVVNCSLPVIS